MILFTNLAHAARKSIGDFISGEVKVAMALRILAGGTYMDLGLIFELGETYRSNSSSICIVSLSSLLWIGSVDISQVNLADSVLPRRH